MKQKKVKFIKRPNTLKMNAGHGGISKDAIKKAERFIANYDADFGPEAREQINRLKSERLAAYEDIKKTKQALQDITSILKPILILKAHGGMFSYHLISDVASIVLDFLENIKFYDLEALNVIEAHEHTLNIIISNELKGDGGQEGHNLVMELHRACKRYFEKHPHTLKVRN